MPDTHGIGSFAPISTAEITSEIWQEIGRQRPSLRKTASPPAGTPARVCPEALSLPNLLALCGPAFIEAAYTTLLGRAPDASGNAYFTATLAQGGSKLRLLGELQASAEGRQSGRTLPGLRPRYLVHRIGASALRRVGIAPRRSVTRVELTAMETALSVERRVLEEQMAELRLAVALAARRLAGLQAAHEEFRLTSATDQGRHLAALGEQAAALARRLAATEDSVIDSLRAVTEGVTSHERRLVGIEAGIDLARLGDRVDEAASGLRAELGDRVIAAEALVARNRQDVVDQQRRIGLMLNAVRDRVPAAVDAEDDHALDGLYLEFEDRFRGSRADIKQRQRVYVPRLRQAGSGSPEHPVLDIGAGRGEFLELMRDEGLVARGVDANAAMVTLCRSAGLDCTEADALAYLAAQPDGSLGAVTGFHIVEHLPFKVVVRVMDEALRSLAPGGLIIFETPNPANILTASRNFYLDPTHRNPLPGEMMAMIAEARGFADAEIVELHPMTARFPGADRLLAAALDRIFHGPQDYALVARKTGARRCA